MIVHTLGKMELLQLIYNYLQAKYNHDIELTATTYEVIDHINADNTMCFYAMLYDFLVNNDERFFNYMNTYVLYSAIHLIICNNEQPTTTATTATVAAGNNESEI
jgi:hypothetical protein